MPPAFAALDRKWGDAACRNTMTCRPYRHNPVQLHRRTIPVFLHDPPRYRDWHTTTLFPFALHRVMAHDNPAAFPLRLARYKRCPRPVPDPRDECRWDYPTNVTAQKNSARLRYQ